MSEEKRPILRSLLDMDSYLSTSASEKSATIISDGSNHDQRATVVSYVYKQLKNSRLGRCWWNRGVQLEKFHDRVVDRDGDFHQSNGKMAIKKKIRGEDWRALYAGDLFHSLIDAPSSRSIGILLSGYLLLVVLFSIPYYHISTTYGCDMGIDTYQESFAFSLETMATIGYGTQDIFFNNCWSPIVVLACQISCKLVADAVIIGVIYSRFGRPNTRASTILFSNHAVIRRIAGKLYFMFQLVELRKHQLIEAQVRLYVIRRDIDPPSDLSEDGESSSTGTGLNAAGKHSLSPAPASSPVICNEPAVTNFQTCKMRLNFPNDELGGLLIMCLPQVIVHEIDAGSPLMPPPVWRSCRAPDDVYRWKPRVFEEAGGGDRDYSAQDRGPTEKVRSRHVRNHHTTFRFPNVVQRSKLSTVRKPRGNGEIKVVAKETFAQVLKRPESKDGFELNKASDVESEHSKEACSAFGSYLKKPSLLPDPQMTPQRTGDDPIDDSGGPEGEKWMVSHYMMDRRMEVMAVVEGIDATTGGVVQARHSFVCSEVEWDRSFAPCVFEDQKDGSAIIDFSVFHDLVVVEEDATHPGPTPSHT